MSLKKRDFRNAILWPIGMGFLTDHQSYSREGSGVLGKNNNSLFLFEGEFVRGFKDPKLSSSRPFLTSEIWLISIGKAAEVRNS